MNKPLLAFGVAFLVGVMYVSPPRFSQLPIRTVTVVGEAQTQKKNEVAMFSAGVNAVNDDKQKAVDEVNIKATELINAVKKFGVNEKDIKTQNLNIYQNQESYYEDGRQKQRLGQWNVGNTIEITLRNVAQTDALTLLLSQSGANNIYGPNLSLEKSTSNDVNLTQQAVADAKSKAASLAKLSGAKLGKVVTIAEDNASAVNPYAYSKGYGGGGGGMPSEVGSTTITKTVTVTYEMH